MQAADKQIIDATHTDINTAAEASVQESLVEGTPAIGTEEVSVEAKAAEVQIKVSVIVPIYNAEAFLQPALDSILDQTLREIEVICVDDGSTDGSLKMVKEYQKRDARVRIATQNNAGPGMARNNGLPTRGPVWHVTTACAAPEASTWHFWMRMISLPWIFLKECMKRRSPRIWISS